MNDSVSNICQTPIEIYTAKEKPQKKKIIQSNMCIRYFLFFNFIVLGFFNHLGYYLIMTSSQQFATKLGNESLIACYPLALILFSSFTRVINSKYCINISYYIRVLILSAQFFVGYITLFVILQSSKIIKSKNMAFWLTMIPTTIVGMGESFGEVTILGFVGTLKGNYISGWNIGSALAGVSGSFLSLLFKKLNTNLKDIYLFLTPTSFFYIFVFIFINLCGAKEKKIITKKKFHKMHEEKNVHVTDIGNDNEIANNKVLNIKNFKEGFKSAHKYIINLALLNFLQYTICYCFCERANKYKFINSKGTILEKIQYEALLLFFETGVVLSNSCLFIIKHIKYLEIFTILQVFNFIFWFFECLFGLVSNQWICFIHLFFVGICGGGGNIGFLHKMFNSNKISHIIKELCLNICEFFMDWGILLSSIISIIFDNTLMKIEK